MVRIFIFIKQRSKKFNKGTCQSVIQYEIMATPNDYPFRSTLGYKSRPVPCRRLQYLWFQIHMNRWWHDPARLAQVAGRVLPSGGRALPRACRCVCCCGPHPAPSSARRSPRRLRLESPCGGSPATATIGQEERAGATPSLSEHIGMPCALTVVENGDGP